MIPEKLTQFESQVFEDITNDYYANKFSQDMQMPNLLRVSVDGDASVIGARGESAFRLDWRSFDEPCLLRQLTTLELCITSDFLRQRSRLEVPPWQQRTGWPTRSTKLLSVLTGALVLAYSGLSDEEKDQKDQELIDVYDANTEQSYSNYLEHKARIEREDCSRKREPRQVHIHERGA